MATVLAVYKKWTYRINADGSIDYGQFLGGSHQEKVKEGALGVLKWVPNTSEEIVRQELANGTVRQWVPGIQNVHWQEITGWHLFWQSRLTDDAFIRSIPFDVALALYYTLAQWEMADKIGQKFFCPTLLEPSITGTNPKGEAVFRERIYNVRTDLRTMPLTNGQTALFLVPAAWFGKVPECEDRSVFGKALDIYRDVIISVATAGLGGVLVRAAITIARQIPQLVAAINAGRNGPRIDAILDALTNIQGLGVAPMDAARMAQQDQSRLAPVQFWSLNIPDPDTGYARGETPLTVPQIPAPGVGFFPALASGMPSEGRGNNGNLMPFDQSRALIEKANAAARPVRLEIQKAARAATAAAAAEAIRKAAEEAAKANAAQNGTASTGGSTTPQTPATPTIPVSVPVQPSDVLTIPETHPSGGIPWWIWAAALLLI